MKKIIVTLVILIFSIVLIGCNNVLFGGDHLPVLNVNDLSSLTAKQFLEKIGNYNFEKSNYEFRDFDTTQNGELVSNFAESNFPFENFELLFNNELMHSKLETIKNDEDLLKFVEFSEQFLLYEGRQYFAILINVDKEYLTNNPKVASLLEIDLNQYLEFDLYLIIKFQNKEISEVGGELNISKDNYQLSSKFKVNFK